MKEIIIIILNYNDSVSVLKCIYYIKQIKNIDIKIVIVDNASTDNSFEIINEKSDKNIKVIRNATNLGYASGNNIGYKYAKENFNGIKYVAICNPDVILNENCLNKILLMFQKYPEYKALSGRMKNLSGNFNESPYLFKPTYFEALADCFFITRRIWKIFSKVRCNVDSNKDIQTVYGLPGCFFVVNIEDLSEMELFDEHTFLYYEENILAKKMEQKKLKRGIVPSAFYIHNHSISVDKSINSFNKMKIFFQSVLYYFIHYEKINKLQYHILSFCQKISLFEYKIRMMLIKIF